MHDLPAHRGQVRGRVDCDRGKRPGNFADMCDYLKLVHRLNVIHQEGGCPIEPTLTK